MPAAAPIADPSLNTHRVITVWDRFVRSFHWSLALAMAGAYLSGTFHWMSLHTWLGYFIGVLVLARVAWGFVGSQYARFRSFLFGPRMTLGYLIAILRNRPGHFLGHNPAGAAMVYALLLCVGFLVVSGLTTLGCIDLEGPLTFIAYALADDTCYQIQSWHESWSAMIWWLIAAHVLGVILASIQHKENLVAAMFHGRKKTQ